MKIVGAQFHCCSTDVFLEAMQLRSAGDRNDPGFLCEQPRERDLRGRRMLPECDSAEQINENLIGLASLRLEARNGVAEVAAVERGVLADRAGQKTLPQRTEGHEADPELLEGRKDLLFGLPPPQRVFALKRRDRLDRMGAANRLCACFR